MEYLQTGFARAYLRALSKPGAKPASYTDLKVCGPDIVNAMKARERDYREFNRDMKASDGASLSGSAQAYWQDAQKMLAFGKRVHDTDNSKARVAKLSKWCERLEESFAALVPANERGMFLVHDLEGRVWDSRWYCCHDFTPPILRAEFAGVRIAQPKWRAQVEVLAELLEPQAAASPSTFDREKLIVLARRLSD